MAKVVNTKYGDRRLVHLPPVSMSGASSPQVDTIAPRDAATQDYRRRGHRSRDGRGRVALPVLEQRTSRSEGGDRWTARLPLGRIGLAEAKAEYVHKQYAYRSSKSEGGKYQTKNAWVGAPIPGQRPEGNLVTDSGPPKRLGSQIFQQLYQEASANTMQGYSQGQYPVIPPVNSAPHYMQYTNHGLANMPQAQTQPAQGFQQPAPMQYPMQQMVPQGQPPVPAPAPAPVAQNPQPGGQERHIYYGPNGEVLPGPPAGFNPHGTVNCQDCPDDFAIEGLLQFGRMTNLTLIESSRGFPKIPEFLVRDLIDKYGHIERTIVRIVFRGGQAYVHATPEMIGVGMGMAPDPEPEYVPVYLDEGEEFDYDKFMREYRGQQRYGGGGYRYPVQGGPPRRYASPPPIRRSYPRRDDDGSDDRRRNSPDIRPETDDPVSHLRWNKVNNAPHSIYPGRSRIDTAPVFPPDPPTRDSRRF